MQNQRLLHLQGPAEAEATAIALVGDITDPIAAWSPAGDRLAFSRRAESEKYPYELYLMAPDGAGTTVQVQFLSPPTSVAWAPAGDRLACTVPIDGRSSLYLVRPRLGQATRLSPFLTMLSDSAVWSPDGAGMMVAASGEAAAGWRLFWLDTIHGRPAKQLSTVGYAAPGAVSWSGDGHWVAWVTGTFSEPGRGLLTVVQGADLLHHTKPVKGLRWVGDPRFSPASDWLAVSAERRTRRPKSSLVLLRPESPESWCWVELPEEARSPEFSPDGRRLAWIAGELGAQRVEVETMAALLAKLGQTVQTGR